MSAPAEGKSRQEYRIRVRPKVPFPKHGPQHLIGKGSSGKLPPPANVELILGAPFEAFGDWKKCGTDMLWPVIEVIGAPDFKMHSLHAVCRHQIQIGD